MPTEKINLITRREWRELGYFYDRDDSAKEWLIAGSANGLTLFADFLKEYAEWPGSAKLSEHAHLGPYMYLKIGTWDTPKITNNWIAAPVNDLLKLSISIRKWITNAKPGERRGFRDQFAPGAEFDLILELKDSDFDPAKADRACWPALFPDLLGKKWAEVNLDAVARRDFRGADNPLLDPQKCDDWVKAIAREQNVDFTYGGYLEDREHLWRGHYLPPGPQTHLGVDYNVPAGTRVALVADGEVIHVARDGNYGSWGGLVVLRLDVPPAAGADYLFYGHLRWDDLPTKGQKLKAGDIVGCIGAPHQNGVWFPHLHVQFVSEKQIMNTTSIELIDGYMKPPVPSEDFPDPRPLVPL